jgi:hypothetical protein
MPYVPSLYANAGNATLQSPPRQTEGDFDLIEQRYDTDKLLPDNGKLLTQWQRFTHKLKVMNQRAPKEVTYRLLYLGRHGQGYHNVGIMFYGDAAWDVSLVVSLHPDYEIET